MDGALLEEAEGLLGKLPHLFPDERERVRAALARGDAAARTALLEKLRAAADEYARSGKKFEKAAAAALDHASAKLAGARRKALKGAVEGAESADRARDGDPSDLLAGL